MSVSRANQLAEEFCDLWLEGDVEHPPDAFAFINSIPAAESEVRAEIISVDQSNRWKRGIGVPVERYFQEFPSLAADHKLKLNLIVAEFLIRRELGETPEIDNFVSRFPDCREALQQKLQGQRAAIPTEKSPEKAATINHDSSGENTSPENVNSKSAQMPSQIGRYIPRKILGEAGFGVVFLAYDGELQREVALKVPRDDRIVRPEDVQLYLAEAQMVAALDHENIVPVHDFGRTDDGMCFMVTKLIDGVNLARQLQNRPPSIRESARIIASIADALHHAHTRPAGLVHRDVKPANILIDSAGKPYLADFGLAIKEEDFGKGTAFAGTVPYMSPEQARWEGHRVDGRSDIFSLGSVFYELLTGEQPFGGYTKTDTLERIKFDEPRPPRQRNDSIPKELERICLKALSKRVSDRYLTALDMADDIRRWLKEEPVADDQPQAFPQVPASATKHSSAQPVPIRPKGLRSFDSGDTDFFLKLLPGPRDRHGIPESVRFWKNRIEETDGIQTFRVGVIYGPSGSGKSSLLKAGLLPLLDTNIEVIYAEATPKGTADRLLQLLRMRFGELESEKNLADALAAVRRGSSATGKRKVLIVLDQFEQWLHNRDHDGNQNLVEALRQCDGQRVQAVLTVRDDFWMGISRVMHDLEIDLIPGDNVSAIDLFGR